MLRLRKSDLCKEDEPVGNCGKLRTLLAVNFFKSEISKWMGCYASEPEIVLCGSEELARLMSRFEKQRPGNYLTVCQ